MADDSTGTVQMTYQGQLRGHGGWVTCIATPGDTADQDTIISGSRDKQVIVWDVSRGARQGDEMGRPKKALVGHSDFVQDVALSSDGQFALSASWDKTIRLWDIAEGRETERSPFRVNPHTKDVMSVAFSSDNRQILSASRDHSVKLWNTLGSCKYTLEGPQGHSHWVSCVRFAPERGAGTDPLIVSGGWDKKVKLWSLRNFSLVCDLTGHTSPVTSLTVSPDGSLCASGSKDGTAILWDLREQRSVYELENAKGDSIHALTFSPTRYWLCAATESAIRIWDLEDKSSVAELVPAATDESTDTRAGGKVPQCISLAWSHDGQTLYSGYTDDVIRVWSLSSGVASM